MHEFSLAAKFAFQLKSQLDIQEFHSKMKITEDYIQIPSYSVSHYQPEVAETPLNKARRRISEHSISHDEELGRESNTMRNMNKSEILKNLILMGVFTFLVKSLMVYQIRKLLFNEYLLQVLSFPLFVCISL